MTQLVWFKRDLRVRDHLPLVEAARAGKVLPVYVVEPDLQRQPDYAARHWEFTRECLAELRQNLAALGAPLVVRVGGVTDVFTELHRRYSVIAIWSHQETGNDWTFRRDCSVASWARALGIPWTEFPQFGVVRGLRSRDGWSRRWETFMRRPVAPTPEAIRGTTGIDPGVIPDSLQLRFAAEPGSHRQEGGTSAGLERLNGFIESRGVAYHREMSSPLTAEHSCSRLSAHLAAGTLSMREVAQATWRRRDTVMAQRRQERRGQGAALRAFIGRLHWHCHFIQKLEDAPEHEFRNVHRGYDGMRESEFDLGRLRHGSRKGRRPRRTSEDEDGRVMEACP